MRVRRPLALLFLALAAALAVGLVVVFRGGSSDPEGEAVAAATTLAPPPAETAAEPAPVSTEEGPAFLVYAEGAHDVAFEPRLSARSYIAVDAATGRILIARRERQRRPIASLTKIMTALVVIEAGQLAGKAQVPAEAINVEPNREGLVKGRWYPRKLLLYSALMVSANDSAVTLAYDAGRGSVTRFYRLMNRKARQLGLTDTTYHDASGLNDETNVSSARDQAILSRAALESPVFASIVRTHRRLVDWPPPTYRKEWVNHNRMLVSYPGTYGVKTGYTTKAGGCLAVAVRRDGHTVIAVVLGSKHIWADMPRLVDEAFARMGG